MSRYRWLGQDINIGKYIGLAPSHCAVLENATGFSMLAFFESAIKEGLTEYCVICKNSANENIFALAYNHTSRWGWGTWIKWASSGDLIADGDKPPYFAPWNNWIHVGSFTFDNPTLDEMLDCSFAFFEIETNLLPYWNGNNDNEYNLSDLIGTGSNIYICLELREDDGTTPAVYTEPTPILIHGTAYTNWIDANTVTDPSYYLSGLGSGDSRIYNPLYITDATEIDSSETDTSTPGGGGSSGYYGWEGGNIWFSNPLALSAIDTGMLTLFNPDKTQVRALANYLWNDSSFFTNLQKLWTEPMDTIISFGIIPCDLSSITDNMASNIYVGNCNTGLTAFKLNKQYYKKEFGYVNIPLNSKNALDFEPFCKAQMYLPYIGFVPIKINEIMQSKVYLTYWIDCLSGDCIAQIGVEKYTNYQTNLRSVLYEYHGNCLIKLPLCSRDFSSFYKNLITAPVGAISGAVGGGSVGGGVSNGVASVVDTFLDGPDIQRSGAYSGSSSAFALRTPYIVVTKACQQMPANYSKYVGYPSFITYTLSDLSGYTVVDGVIDNTVKATDTEKQEIEKLLKEGVIL